MENNVLIHMLTPLTVFFFVLSSWSDVELWVEHILVPHLHTNPSLSLVGLVRLQCTPTVTPGVNQGDSVITKKLVFPDLELAELTSQK